MAQVSCCGNLSVEQREDDRRIKICRCCWLATKPFSDYDMIETQVMVTPKTKKKNGVPPSVDVNRMHLEYKWELPINHGTDMSKKSRGIGCVIPRCFDISVLFRDIFASAELSTLWQIDYLSNNLTKTSRPSGRGSTRPRGRAGKPSSSSGTTSGQPRWPSSARRARPESESRSAFPLSRTS